MVFPYVTALIRVVPTLRELDSPKDRGRRAYTLRAVPWWAVHMAVRTADGALGEQVGDPPPAGVSLNPPFFVSDAFDGAGMG
ncbi:MAG: hypothetical protein JJT89_16590, partial [Nitriliruptoraceae bacterium]|nr:hypothetical protein [Nitriliruptoraceae bacterium]